MRKGIKRRDTNIVELNITALLDMFTMLLIFLLINYSASSYSSIKPSGHLVFPTSTSDKKSIDMLSIVVDKYNIIVDGQLVLKHKLGEVSPADIQDGYKIVPLYTALMRYAEKTRYIASRNINVETEGKVILQMDKSLPFSLLRQVMYTAGQAEYNDFKFIALKK
ncbi:MAG: biopolymer transporter ExbD [Pseudomonadota bacterium]